MFITLSSNYVRVARGTQRNHKIRVLVTKHKQQTGTENTEN